LIEAVSRFELGGPIDPWLLRRNAERFGSDRFREEFGRVVELAIEADAGMNRQMEVVNSDRHAHIAVQSAEDEATSSYRYTRI
jgi:hypothetical protein